MSSIRHMILKSSSRPNSNPIQPRTSSSQSQILFFVKSLEGSMEAEAVDDRLEEAEVKEKLTAVPSLIKRFDRF